MARHTIVKHVRQPAADGPDVIFNPETHYWDLYVDGRYLGSRDHSQTAWIEAHRVHFEGIEQAAIVTADLEALPFEPTEAELEAYAAEWDTAVADERAALDTYAQERDAAIIASIRAAIAPLIESADLEDDDPTEEYGNPNCTP